MKRGSLPLADDAGGGMRLMKQQRKVQDASRASCTAMLAARVHRCDGDE